MNKKDLVYYLLYGSLFIDSINGILIRETGLSLSPIYKGLILILCLALLRNTAKYILILATFSVFIFAHGLLLSVFSLAKSLDWLTKALYIYLLFSLLSKDAASGNIENISKLAKISFFVLAFNIWLGSLGYGYAQYTSGEQSFGTRGFIFAGNEISVAIMCSSGLIMANYLLIKKIKKYLIFSFFALSTAALTTMKVSILSVLLMFIFLPLINGISGGVSLGKRAILILSIAITTPIITALAASYILFDTGLIDRISYFYEKNGLITMLFSMRNIWALYALDTYMGYGALASIFGTGLDWVKDMPHGGLIEIDPIDILMSYGVIGFCITTGFFLWIFSNVSKNKNKTIKMQSIFMLALLISISATAGHVVFSGIAAPLIASVLAYGFYVKPRTV